MKIKSVMRNLLPKTIHPHHILSGPLRGCRIVTSWHDYPAAILGRTEKKLLDWFEQNVKKDETWLDVGAHYGYTAIALCRLVGANGRVFAFEPMLQTAGCLTQTRLLNGFSQLTVLPLALSSSPHVMVQQLPTTRGMVDSTLLTKRLSSDDVWREAFITASLDSLWEGISGDDDRVHGIKIDVQGMEIETIKGMTQLLKKFKPKLVVELHHGVSRPEFLQLLAALGYSTQGIPIEPVPGEITPQYIDDHSYAFQ
jgi:FkbM family methyltransferase